MTERTQSMNAMSFRKSMKLVGLRSRLGPSRRAERTQSRNPPRAGKSPRAREKMAKRTQFRHPSRAPGRRREFAKKAPERTQSRISLYQTEAVD